MIKIPSIPRSGLPGTGQFWKPGKSERDFKRWMIFAREEFTLIYLWSYVEKDKFRDRLLDIQAGDVSQHPVNLHHFNLVQKGLVTEEMYLGKKEGIGSVTNFLMHHLRTLAGCLPYWKKGGELLKHMESHEELFFYFVSRDLDYSPLTEEEFHAQLKPRW